MILPDFVLPSRVDLVCDYMGIDSAEECCDKQHFQNYPFRIQYNFNSRGFRDEEWPDSISKLKQAIWCVGDSFTVGIGSPLTHTWPYLLAQATKRRTINVSMDGASNNWIARKASKVLTEIQPEFLVIQWSYITRREATDLDQVLEKRWKQFYDAIKDPTWPSCDWFNVADLPQAIIDEIRDVHNGSQYLDPVLTDEDLRVWFVNCDSQQDLKNTVDCVQAVDKARRGTRVIHSFIPFCFLDNLEFQNQIQSQMSGIIIPQIQPVDLARDGHHYDIETSSAFVKNVVALMSFPDSTD